ncbi:MAG: hypothetical protein RIE77_11380 [Phycisphaerales bacterium]|jgi:hypothetical protein
MRAAIVLAAVLCAWFVATCQAQSEQRLSGPTVLLDLGFNGTLPADRWAPVRVVVSPLEEAVQGVARIRVTMPNGSIITTLVPVATTPGRETIVPATVWIPPSIGSLHVAFLSESGSIIAQTSYGAVAGAQAVRLQPPTHMPIILGVGTPSLRLAFGLETYERDFSGPGGEIVRARAAVARVVSAVPPAIGLPPWMPTDAMAYDGLSAVVIDGAVADRLEPDALDALREWIVSGGRLQVVNANNNGLRLILGQYLPEGLSIGPTRQVEMPDALGGPGPMAARTFDASSMPTAWKAEWQGLTATGPVGLGMVSITGFDPDVLADQDRISATEMAWHTMMGPLITDRLERGRRLLNGTQWDDTSLETVSTIAVLDWVSRAPVVGRGAFLAIFAMMFVLAFALGPIDRFILKRLRSLHRWWLTAAAWIALATVGAWMAPSHVRSGPTSVGSMRVVDSWQDPTGETLAWQHTVSGIFLNRSASIYFDDLERTSWLSAATHPWQPTTMGSLSLVSTGSAPVVRPTTGRLWTTRNFEQQGLTTLPISVRFSEDRRRFELRLSGPGVDRIEHVAVRTDRRWLHLLPGGSPRYEGSDLVLRAIERDLSTQPPRSMDVGVLTDSYDGLRPYMYGYSDRQPPPSLVMQQAGPAQRGAAFNALSNTDEWAVVYLAWESDDPLIASGVGESFDTSWIARIAVPVERTP